MELLRDGGLRPGQVQGGDADQVISQVGLRIPRALDLRVLRQTEDHVLLGVAAAGLSAAVAGVDGRMVLSAHRRSCYSNSAAGPSSR